VGLEVATHAASHRERSPDLEYDLAAAETGGTTVRPPDHHIAVPMFLASPSGFGRDGAQIRPCGGMQRAGGAVGPQRSSCRLARSVASRWRERVSDLEDDLAVGPCGRRRFPRPCPRRDVVPCIGCPAEDSDPSTRLVRAWSKPWQTGRWSTRAADRRSRHSVHRDDQPFVTPKRASAATFR